MIRWRVAAVISGFLFIFISLHCSTIIVLYFLVVILSMQAVVVELLGGDIMERFVEKYIFWFTAVIGVDALVVLIFNWNTIDMVQKLPIMYIVALALHEGEELKLPGGFVELVTTITGIKIKNIGLAKFGLLLFTLWATIIPAFLASYI